MFSCISYPSPLVRISILWAQKLGPRQLDSTAQGPWLAGGGAMEPRFKLKLWPPEARPAILQQPKLQVMGHTVGVGSEARVGTGLASWMQVLRLLCYSSAGGPCGSAVCSAASTERVINTGSAQFQGGAAPSQAPSTRPQGTRKSTGSLVEEDVS